MQVDNEDFQPMPDTDDDTVNENRRLARCSINLDVPSLVVKIPRDVHFQNEVQTIKAQRVEFARTSDEINSAFFTYIDGKGSQFERKSRTDKIAGYLQEMIADYFGIYDNNAKKVVLDEKNRPKFDFILEKSLETYARFRKEAAVESAANRVFEEYFWEVPEQQVYDADTHRVVHAKKSALTPFVALKIASTTEKEFVEFLEANSQYIDWWYKNGDNGKHNFAVEYRKSIDGGKELFYVDFIIRMKNGHVYFFDTKKGGLDVFAVEKHNGLLKYIEDNSTEQQPLAGGIIVKVGSNWMYSPDPIDNITDTLQWKCFYPEGA